MLGFALCSLYDLKVLFEIPSYHFLGGDEGSSFIAQVLDNVVFLHCTIEWSAVLIFLR